MYSITNFPFTKKPDHVIEGILQNMDVWDWVVTHDGQVRQIEHDDQMGLPGEAIARFATLEEVHDHLISINGKGAAFSPNKVYRYALWRLWDFGKPPIVFVGLNPSTANDATDDPTIRRVKRFARDNGFGGVIMLNLFGLVTPKPKVLALHPDPICQNEVYLNQYARAVAEHKIEVVFCWGAFKEAKPRTKFIESIFPNALCLGFTGDGSPRHPLFLNADTPFEKYLQKK